ncbi:MAG TPA: mycofactocin-associated electron transfer flavoprotein beta subunit [Ilumatobacteraceae bacterium]|nr:mycofactocin-associated electron transfer flavoprotein beta subunit [Ilumatobacteraceae bacterium]
MKIAVCWKWVSLDREHVLDERWAGVSAADEAALETALTIADTLADGTTVTVIGLGPADADDVLRRALAVGATAVRRLDASPELDSRTVALAIAALVADADLVVCGDYSIDRGTGSVPAFVAAELGVAQALGLVEIDTATAADPPLRALRRLDGGRRELLDVPIPAVVSVEGSVARLRRAPLTASLSARSTPIDVVAGPHGRAPETEIHPYRPRPRTLPAPSGDTLSRVRSILDVGGDDSHAETVTLDPPAAALRIIEQLRDWGYEPGGTGSVDAPR